MSRLALDPRALACAGALLLAPLALACASSNTAPPPAQPDAGPLFQPTGMDPGARVLVERGGQWLPATIIGRVAPDRLMVRYEGYGPEWNEAVPPARVRAAPAAAGAADYRVGEKVLVVVQGKQLLADVVAQSGPAEWRVHYDGYGPEVAENVKPDRLRRPFVGATAHPLGEPVSVDVGGRHLPARVLAATAADRWLVRFDGFGPEYDQEVNADRFRAAAAPAAPGAAPAPAMPAGPGAPAAPAAAAPAGPAAPAASKPGAPPAASAGGPLQANEEVLVAHRGAYHPAIIVGPGTAGKWRVRYTTSAVGNEQSLSGSDEEVSADRVSRALAPEKGARFQPNQRIFVEWHGLYFPGKVTKTEGKGQYRVRYENFGPEADEVIPARRLRPRP